MDLTVSSCHVTHAFQSESTFYIYLNCIELLAQNRRDISSLNDCYGSWIQKNLIRKWTLNHLVKLTKWLNWLVSTYLYVAFDCMFLSCLYTFHTKSTLSICLNFKKLLARNRHDSSSLGHCNGTRTDNHSVRKLTLNHFAKLTKWLRWVTSTYLYGAFHCMFLWCHVRLSAWIHALYLSEFQGTCYSKQAQYLKFKWLQRESNPQPLNS